MKYNDDNLDSSAVEILPERKRSFFSWRNLLDTLILFGLVSFLCWSFCRIQYDFSVLDDMNYKIPLRDIVIIANGFDIHNLILPVSITITLLLRATELSIISIIKWVKYDFIGACGCLLGLFLFFIFIFQFILYLSYAYFIKEENTKNAGNKYIVNVDIRRIDDSTRGKDWIIFVFNDREVYIRNYYKHEYLRDLKSALNKKISLVVRDGGRGIPIIDDYKIFYDKDVPTTVEEFYNGKKEIEEPNRKLEYEKAYANLPLSAFGEYFRERMPKVSKRITDRVSAEYNVMKTGEINGIEITQRMTSTANEALLKALKNMGTWIGEPIDDDVRMSIDVDYVKGEPRFMYVVVKRKDSSRMYTDCYDINETGAVHSDHIDY